MTDRRGIMVIDGLNSLFQLSHNQTPSKEVLWQFVTDIKRMMGELQISRVVMTCDKGESRYRIDLHPGYKGERKAQRAKDAIENPAKAAADKKFRDLAYRVVDLLPAFGIETVCLPGIEADDVIAYLTNHADLSVYQLWVLSTDTDLLQLVREGVHQRGYCKLMGLKPSPVKLPEKVWVNPKRYQDAFGFPPEKHTEMKALAGDRGDSVPSPEGIGEGWAWKLIQRFGSLQGVKDNLDNLDIPRFPVKAKANLKAQWPLVEQALKLVNLRHSAEEEQAIFTADERALLDEVIDRFSEDPKLDVPRIKDMMLEAGKVGMYKAFDIWALPLTGKIIHF